jgi:hypothetical protein
MSDITDDGFTLDLRGYTGRPRRRRNRNRELRLDSWTANSSPLEHYQLEIAECLHLGDPSEREECKAAVWARHLERCRNCARQERWAEIRAFAREHAAELEALHS